MDSRRTDLAPEDHAKIHTRLQTADRSRLPHIRAAEVKLYEFHIRSCPECRALFRQDAENNA